MTNTFSTLKLIPELLTNLASLGHESMTPIQEKALPCVLNGQDVIAKAKTGSGKTAAFSLGILNQLEIENKNIQALILCPTHELAAQVAEEIRKLSRLIKNSKTLVICGGSPEYPQLNSLMHGAHIVVGTPGRVLKFLKKGSMDIRNIKHFVLDEADRMLDMGFREDIESIKAFVPRKTQTLLFSATFPDDIRQLSQEFQNNPVEVTVDTTHEENVIKQYFIELGSHQDKLKALLNIFRTYTPESSVIFCKTKQLCADVARALSREGVEALAMHGDLDQNERTVVLAKFSNKSSPVLVATDVAARGLDVKDLEAVVNFDMATDPEVYTHRIGRTGRAGKEGMSFTLFVESEFYKIEEIEDFQNKKIETISMNDLNTTGEIRLTSKMKTLYINGGKKDKLRKGDILGAIIGEIGLTLDQIGMIQIFDKQSFVAIDRSVFDLVSKKLEKIKGKRYKVGPA